MKRVSSLDVSMKLLPAEEADMTDVELSITKGKQIKGSLSVDDSGLEDTGSIQWNAALGIDRLFNANDLFRISGNTDGSRDGYEKEPEDRAFPTPSPEDGTPSPCVTTATDTTGP